MDANNLKKVVFLGTGGTIAGVAAHSADDLGYTAAQIKVEQLLLTVPGLHQALQGHAVHSEQVAQLDSKDMDFATMARLAARCLHWMAQPDVAGIVITHGTDTLEETAYFLHLLLPTDKSVVLTCAMRPATSRHADGPANVRDAVAVALDPQARGVLCVCAGKVRLASRVQKIHAHQLDAFSSGDAGPAGRVKQVVQAVQSVHTQIQVTWSKKKQAFYPTKRPLAHTDIAQAAMKNIAKLSSLTRWPRVEIVLNHAGASGAVVRALLNGQGAEKLDGIVAAGTGNGTLHTDLEAALIHAQAQGIAVVRSSRCAGGGVQATGRDVLPDAGGLTYAQTRIRLVLELAGIELAGIALKGAQLAGQK